MQSLKERLSYLFTSTKGLILTAIAMVSLVTAIWGGLSGPMVDLGVREFMVKNLGVQLAQVEREGRIILLYHAIAMAVIAIEVYMVTGIVAMKARWRTLINATVTVGYLTSMIFGLMFAYFGRNIFIHILYVGGLTAMFAAGVMLVIALWPWNKEYLQHDPAYARTRSGIDLERVAFFATALTTLLSSLFGAIPGVFFGNGFNVFLAENVIRFPGKSVLQYAVIGHLHIMLALIAIMITLIVGRWLGFKGILHKIAMPLMILGTIVLNLGVWGVVTPYQPIAHMIIYVGATPSMVAALLLLIWSWNDLIKTGTAGIEKPTFGQKMKALLRDPLKFGPTWQMLFMNFTTSGLGIFMAVKLDEIFRQWPAREERIELTGHWHVLSAIVATIILFYYGDMAGLKGRWRKIYGWTLIIFSDIAMAAVTLFEMKRLFISEATQQPLVNVLILVMDTGVGIVLLTVGILLAFRFYDLFRHRGRWREEREHNQLTEVSE